jgi:hypothetical protein
MGHSRQDKIRTQIWKAVLQDQGHSCNRNEAAQNHVARELQRQIYIFESSLARIFEGDRFSLTE